MRRKEKEITDLKEIEAIIKKAEICRLGLAVNNTPYIVPVNYGYEDHCLFIHCAKTGRKLDMIRRNNRVCFEMDVDAEIKDKENSPCEWSSSYRSVIGYGRAFIIDRNDEKKKALDVIMRHYSGQKNFEYKESSVENVGIIKIEITEIIGKHSL